MIKKVTSKQKKAAIEALFSSSKDTVVGDNFKFLLWSHEKGLYSGFSKVQKQVKSKKQDKYYGFVIDLVHGNFSMEGVSGKQLANTGSNLKEVFAYGAPFSEKYLPNPSSSMEVFKCAGKLLGDINYAEQPNFGRGILRLITKYPSLELIVKELYPNKVTRTRDGVNAMMYAIQKYFSNNHITSVRKALHFKVIYNTWKVDKYPLDFLEKIFSNNVDYSKINKYLMEISKYLEVAHDVLYSVDDERGYHDASNWYQQISHQLFSERFRYFPGGPLTQCLDFIKEKKGTTGIKNLFRYSYASLYHQQAFDGVYYAFSELKDYYQLVRDLKNVPLYPRYLKTAHDVASRNVRVLSDDSRKVHVFDCWKHNHKKFDAKIGDYVIYQALTPKEIVEEGTNNSNCVGGYVRSVAEGTSVILFMRNKENPDKSWVTLEVRDNTLVQAYATFDQHLDDKAKDLLSTWCNFRKIGVGRDLGGAVTSDWDKRRVSNKVLPLEEQSKYHDPDTLDSLQKKEEETKVVVDSVSKQFSSQVNSFN